ncbi:hypothetical protein NR798_33675 [Archangium gephyra]|uniref:hypothetical protein n=1 Tax=Archangium gephyra TaxID=48 RepID=UPI0035D4CD0F
MRPTCSRVRRALRLALALCVPALGGCRVDCDFEPHCEGNVVMDCHVGIDQLVGRGSPVVYPCLEPAPLCVESRTGKRDSEGGSISCAREPLTPCDESFTDSCEGTVWVYCQGGYVSAQDCSNQAGTGRCGRRTPAGLLQCL